MPLLGAAAMLLSFDVGTDAIAEHDHWHTYEHLPERLSIPGFLRGSRWVAVEGRPRYMVLYEVESLATLTSPAYLARLDAPTPWTSRMMVHYRGMRRGLCSVAGSAGVGLGRLALLVRFTPAQDGADGVLDWLQRDVLPGLPSRPGLGSAHLLVGAAAARMTNEQRIRGADAAVDAALVVTAHDAGALRTVEDEIAGASGLARHGASDVERAVYAMHYAVSRDDVGA